VLLVVNPAARRGQAGEQEALRAFADAGVHVALMRTTAAGDAARFAAAHGASHDAVFTLGGDGTAMEVVGALAVTGPPVGILPGGTGNQLARHLRTPLHIGRAVRRLLAGDQCRIDLGRLTDGRHFALTAGFGMDVAMMRGASPSLKRRFGVGAYIWSGFRALLKNERVLIRATVDGVTCERRCVMAMIANVGSLLDGFISTGPDIRTDDGLLDVCLFFPDSVPDALALTLRCIRNDFTPHPAMHFARGRVVTLEAVSGHEAQADGEILGPGTLTATAEPLAGVLLRPV
jgi:diacylglycerol kinase family enzyme